MDILPLFVDFTNTFNKIFSNNINPFNLESNIRDVGDSFSLKLYEEYLNYIDISFKNSKYRKDNFYVKETKPKTLITSIGYITVNSTSYYNKFTNERFVPLRNILYLKPYQRLTNEAEFQLIKYAKDVNMSQAAKFALRNIEVSRSCVSKKIRVLDGSIIENIEKSNNQPNVLYIEMDEIHANLQHGGNQICPCAIVHEGYKNEISKRKELKNVRNFASSDLSYQELWEVIYDYVNKKYDIDKFDAIFISGDGAKGIKSFTNAFPNALFVLDKFHYKKKHLGYIFKDNKQLIKYANSYLKNDKIDDFKKLVYLQIEKYPEQKDMITKHMKYLINNLEGIKNQNHPLYKCPCSMEGHVSNRYARYITSSPYGFSKRGLNNKLKLLVYKANNIDLTIKDYYDLKYGKDNYKEIIKNIENIINIKYDQRLTTNQLQEYKITTSMPILDNLADNNRLQELTSLRKETYII